MSNKNTTYTSVMKTDSSIHVENTKRNVMVLILAGFSKSITYCTEDDFMYIKDGLIYTIHDPCHYRFRIIKNDILNVYDDFHKQGIIDFINNEYDYGVTKEEVAEIKFYNDNEER